MAHQSPPKMQKTKATDKGMSRKRMSMVVTLQISFNSNAGAAAAVGAGGFANRKAFSTTNNELKAIPRPAAHAGNQPIKARGMQAAL